MPKLGFPRHTHLVIDYFVFPVALLIDTRTHTLLVTPFIIIPIASAPLSLSRQSCYITPALTCAFVSRRRVSIVSASRLISYVIHLPHIFYLIPFC
ncbi:hypothetical protein EDB86DRAFT_2921550, partial [Lactarius hatsudake]